MDKMDPRLFGDPKDWKLTPRRPKPSPPRIEEAPKKAAEPVENSEFSKGWWSAVAFVVLLLLLAKLFR
jgi:hypothetical protein